MKKFIVYESIFTVILIGASTWFAMNYGQEYVTFSADELEGSWYIEGDNKPYFKLKENGRARCTYTLVVDENGKRKAGGLCDVSCKWLIRDDHLILASSLPSLDFGKIISIENGVMTCDKDGVIERYERKELSMYDTW